MEQSRLSRRARTVIEDPRNELYLSAASQWELVIKHQAGKLHADLALSVLLNQQLAENYLISLAIQPSHIKRVLDLPLHHKDPFDRLLIAQALEENLTLISADPDIRRYPVPVLW